MIDCLGIGVRRLILHVCLLGSACTPSNTAKRTTSDQPDPPDASMESRGTAATTGTILCGSSVCKAGKERCCPIGEGYCEPLKGDSSGLCERDGDTEAPVECDDSSDCAAGETCCFYSNGSDGDVGVGCAGENEECNVAEACPRGGSCLRPGTACTVLESPLLPGICFAEPTPLRCGEKTCEGSTPLCCWDASTKTATCMADEKECEASATDTIRLQCNSSADCAGYACCFFLEGSYCKGGCDAMGSYACQADDDCPADFLGNELRGCLGEETNAPTTSWPPWFKTCKFGQAH